MSKYGLSKYLGDLKDDLRFCGKGSPAKMLVAALFRPQLKLLWSIRTCRFAHLNKWARPLLPALEWRQFKRFGSMISPTAEIGRRVRFPHPTGIIIGVGCVVEDEVTILQQVTLGNRARTGEGREYPIIRKGASIFTGAKILGGIEIGEGAVIGANAVVLKDVPAQSTAVGIPAKVRESQ